MANAMMFYNTEANMNEISDMIDDASLDFVTGGKYCPNGTMQGGTREGMYSDNATCYDGTNRMTYSAFFEGFNRTSGMHT